MSSCTTTTTTETMVCMRDTDGAWCSSTPNSFGPWSACSYASACDEAGTRSRMVTRRRCVTGGCGTMTQTETETGGACARDTDGTPCDDGDVCSDSDQCVSGVCFGLRCGPGSCPPRFIASCTASGCECIPIDE
jgi:hypothetical protein